MNNLHDVAGLFKIRSWKGKVSKSSLVEKPHEEKNSVGRKLKLFIFTLLYLPMKF